MTDTCQNIKDADLDHAIVNHSHPLCWSHCDYSIMLKGAKLICDMISQPYVNIHLLLQRADQKLKDK